jgi:hypothetical protein
MPDDPGLVVFGVRRGATPRAMVLGLFALILALP